MDRPYIDSHQLIDQYVRGKLTDDELEEFEIYMLEHPDIVDDVEFANGMQDVLAESKDTIFPDSKAATITERSGSFWLGRQYAAAATVLLAVSAIVSASLFLQVSGLREEIGDLRSPSAITQELWLESVRGETNHVIELRKGFSSIIRADVGLIEADSYSTELSGEQSNFSWSESGLLPGSECRIAISECRIAILVPAAPAGRYSLRIFAEPDQIESARYEFEVVNDIR